MKKTLSIITVFVLSLCFILVGCSKPLKMPTGKEDVLQVASNGGSVVSVEEYVYFANTFVDYTTLSGNDNTKKTTKHNALYRIKTNEFGYVTKDEDGKLENLERVYSKIAGFNNSNMFVVGNYLYFTSPNTHKEQKTGNDRFDLTTLFRIKLDGTGLKEILTTKTTQGKFYLVTEENPYLLIFDDNKISKLQIKEKLPNVEVLVSDVLDVVFPKQYGQLNLLYYTTDISEDDKDAGLTGNYLNELNLLTNQTRSLGKPLSQTITLVSYENGVLYYKLLQNGIALYYGDDLTLGFGANQVQYTILGEVDGEDSVSQFTPINSDNVVYKAESKIYLSTKAEGNVANYDFVLVNKDANIEYVEGDYVYYTTTNGLYRISYRDRVVQTIAEQKNIKQGSCDIAGEYVYFYAKLDTNTTETYYAFRANLKTAEINNPKYECIATILAEDLTGEAE